MKRLALLLLFASTVGLGAEFHDTPRSSPQWVKSLADFRMHTMMHQERVVTLGLTLLAIEPDEFAGVEATTLVKVLRSHDFHKTDPESHILERLYRYYATNPAELSEEDVAGLKETIRELNAKDDELTYSILKEHGLLTRTGAPTKIGRKYLMIEKIADLVDRGSCPVSIEEFGMDGAGHPRMLPASQYLDAVDQKMARLAAKLEAYYAVATRGRQLEDFRKLNCTAFLQRFKPAPPSSGDE